MDAVVVSTARVAVPYELERLCAIAENDRDIAGGYAVGGVELDWYEALDRRMAETLVELALFGEVRA